MSHHVNVSKKLVRPAKNFVRKLDVLTTFFEHIIVTSLVARLVWSKLPKILVKKLLL